MDGDQQRIVSCGCLLPRELDHFILASRLGTLHKRRTSLHNLPRSIHPFSSGKYRVKQRFQVNSALPDMTSKGEMHFATRTLPSIGLDGAFRVHVLPEHLDQVGLKLGDLCEIADEDGQAVGYGVAWRATDKMGTNPKVRPVKMTEMLRVAYGIKEGSLVNLSRTEAKVVHAETVVLTDVTPNEYIEGHEEELEDGRWRTRCATTLCKLHLIDRCCPLY